MKTAGVADVLAVAGYNVIDAIKQSYAGVAFVVLEPWEERTTPDTQRKSIMHSLQAKVAQIPGARILVANAPSIPGLGSTGGFNFEIQDLNGQGVAALGKVAGSFGWPINGRNLPGCIPLSTRRYRNVTWTLTAPWPRRAGYRSMIVQYPADQPGIAVCQPVQQVGSGLPGLPAGRDGCTLHGRGYRPPESAQQEWRDDPARCPGGIQTDGWSLQHAALQHVQLGCH